MATCEICGGARVVHFHRRQPLKAVARGDSAPTDADQVQVATYPCPECAASVSFDRVQISTASTSQIIDRRMAADEQFMDAVRRDAAFALVDHLMRDGFITFAVRRSPGDPDEFTERVAHTAKVGVLAPKVVATLEERVAERQSEVATEVVDEAISDIRNWGSDFGWTSIDKEQAYRSIKDALAAVLLRREPKQKGDGDGR